MTPTRSSEAAPAREDVTDADVARYDAAVAALDALIEPAPSTRDRSPAAIRARAEHRLERVRRFLHELGDPQAAYPVVHVGGTSGKGSTSTAIAAILSAAGYRVGLHTSPYLQVAAEKLQLDGRLIAPGAFADVAAEVLAAARSWAAKGAGETALTYGEVWVALATSWFARERVDAAVIEVGAGGRFDLTNVVRPAVSVITSVGLDHTVTLGETIPEIAWHKAGIVKAGAPVVTAVDDPVALAVIEREAAAVGASLTRVVAGRTFDVLATDPTGTRWREVRADGSAGATFVSRLPGRFQAANGATALAAVRALRDRGFAVADEAVRAGLAAARLPGRMELVADPSGPTVLLDGAHNPQKVAALAADLPVVLGGANGVRPVVLLGAIAGKDVAAMVGLLAPHASAIVATTPRVRGKVGVSASELAGIVRATGFAGPVRVEADPGAGLAVAVELATAAGAPVVVTGSLFVVGGARSRWYPEAAILRQRTPWPSRETGTG